VPIKASGARTAQMMPGAQYKVYEGAPHGLYITHGEELSRDLVTFIKGA
jgi:non-heme chloroperoxidase